MAEGRFHRGSAIRKADFYGRESLEEVGGGRNLAGGEFGEPDGQEDGGEGPGKADEDRRGTMKTSEGRRGRRGTMRTGEGRCDSRLRYWNRRRQRAAMSETGVTVMPPPSAVFLRRAKEDSLLNDEM